MRAGFHVVIFLSVELPSLVAALNNGNNLFSKLFDAFADIPTMPLAPLNSIPKQISHYSCATG